MVEVCKQWKVKIKLVPKADVAIDRVGANAKDLGTELRELALPVTKRTCFACSARRVVFGIEEQNNRTALKTRERHFAAVIRCECKVRRVLSFF